MKEKLKIAVINGPNLNLLGKREPHIYGSETFEDFFIRLKNEFPEADLTYFQSNHEGELIDFIHKIGFTFDGIVINAGAYTHTSIAIADALSAVKTETVEVHISNVYAREDFRKINHIAPRVKGSIIGLGLTGYRLAVQYFCDKQNFKG